MLFRSRRYGAELDDGLADAVAATRDAIAASVEARERHAEGIGALAARREREVSVLEQVAERLSRE